MPQAILSRWGRESLSRPVEASGSTSEIRPLSILRLMPWHIDENASDCDGYAVVLDETGETVGCHETEADAQAHLAALNSNVEESEKATGLFGVAHAAAIQKWLGRLDSGEDATEIARLHHETHVHAQESNVGLICGAPSDLRDFEVWDEKIRKVSVGALAGAQLPEPLGSAVQQAIDAGASYVDVWVVLSMSGYDVQLVPVDAQLDGETEPEAAVAPDEMSAHALLSAALDDYGWHQIQRSTDGGIERIFIDGRLAADHPAVRKGSLSAKEETRTIAQNKRTKAAREPHAFKAARHFTRDGRRRCLLCGEPEPDGGECAGLRDKREQKSLTEISQPFADALAEPGPSPIFARRPVEHSDEAGLGFVEKADEQRYTLLPWYVPDRVDAHRDFTDEYELQQAIWKVARSGDRSIRLQHRPSIVAGERVEMVSWPFEITVDMIQPEPDGTVRKSQTTFPPGTVFFGVVWEPYAWEMVKNGRIRGLSMAGRADRIAVDLPTGDGE